MHAKTEVRNSIYRKLMTRNGPELKGILKENEALHKHTSWRVGGLARQYYQARDIDDLCIFLTQLPEDEPLLWLGLGSNLLIRDGGFDGTVISTSNILNTIERISDYGLSAGVGVACPKIARFSAQSGMSSAEFLAGIPGSLGGALAMNAGAFGGETWDVVKRVEMINRRGERFYRNRDEFEVAYRSVALQQDEWFVSAELELAKDVEGKAGRTIKSFVSKRAETQPMGLPSCGSVFRNPENDFAARLIEDCELKGMTIGGACVSKKHANFIINLGNASASDIEDLIKLVQQRVKAVHDIDLITEVRIVGEEN